MPAQQKSPPRNKSVARIDPSQMPRPYPPVEDLIYNTRSGSVRKNPPYVNDQYQAVDTGNAIPRHMRVTMTAPPATNAIAKEVSYLTYFSIYHKKNIILKNLFLLN
jgi:hypothetical protein